MSLTGFRSLSILGLSDLLRILGKQAAFSFAVLGTIMFTVYYIKVDISSITAYDISV